MWIHFHAMKCTFSLSPLIEMVKYETYCRNLYDQKLYLEVLTENYEHPSIE